VKLLKGVFGESMKLSLLILAIATIPFTVNAANKEVDLSAVIATSITVGKNSDIVYCLGSVPGFIDGSSEKVKFTPLEDLLKNNLANTTLNSKKKKKRKNNKRCKKKKKCRKRKKNNPSTIPTPNTENPTSFPRITLEVIQQAKSACNDNNFLSLTPYTGNFGEAEARILFERFAFGATEGEIKQAVADGLENTVNRLLTPVDESAIGPFNLNYFVTDLECDGYNFGHPIDNQQACAPGNQNDVTGEGIRLGWYARLRYSPNTFFYKLLFFLHDERMAVSLNVANYNSRWTMRRHNEMLRKAAFTGDYLTFMREWNSDPLGNLIWLDGASNKGQSPNENYAREFWELGTTGPTDLDGKPVYSDSDLAQAALAHSGWTMTNDKALDARGLEYWKTVPAYSPELHAPGTFVIFAGTPYQARVTNAEEVLQATFKHPRTAEHLAEDLWKEFINPYADKSAIIRLAMIIRKNNYNLLPVMRSIMTSQAIYTPKSRKTLIKHPIELIFGYLRTFPAIHLGYNSKDNTEFRVIDWYLSRLGQRPLIPQSVFGWDEEVLAGEQYVLSWRNVVIDLVTEEKEYYLEKGYDIQKDLFSGITTGREAILNLARRLNITLTETQAVHLDQYMNFYLQNCGNNSTRPECIKGNPFYLVRELFDPSPLNENKWNSLYKMQGLIAILMMMPEYRMK
jgi:hypothetical protein